MQLEPTDIDGYLAHHHDMIVLSAIEDARRASEEDVQEMQRRYTPRQALAALRSKKKK